MMIKYVEMLYSVLNIMYYYFPCIPIMIDRPICLDRCALSLPRPSTIIPITVDMLFNIVGHKIDGNYESWEYMWPKTSRDRLAPGRGRLSHTLG